MLKNDIECVNFYLLSWSCQFSFTWSWKKNCMLRKRRLIKCKQYHRLVDE